MGGDGSGVKIYDLFAGIGGFSEAARRVGWTTGGYCEIDKYAVKIYNKNFNTDHTPTDVRQLDPKELPEFDILCAGFPCQDFSIAGKRAGLEGARGSLFFEIARILRDKKPEMFLLENVAGLLSSDNKQTFKTILNTLRKLGYVGQYQVLNSKDFGVPQNRERVFSFGVRGECPPKIFPFAKNGRKIDVLQEENTNTLTAGYAKSQANGSYISEGELKAQGNRIMQVNHQTHSGDRRCNPDGTPPDLNTTRKTKIIDSYNASIVDCPGAIRPNMNNSGPLVINLQPRSPNRPSNTPAIVINNPSTDGSGEHGIKQDDKIRRLTPLECERLQGYPDRWTEGVCDSQRYRLLGNAITVNVVEAIMREIEAQYGK